MKKDACNPILQGCMGTWLASSHEGNSSYPVVAAGLERREAGECIGTCW
jgi:hypothetical protein